MNVILSLSKRTAKKKETKYKCDFEFVKLNS